MAVCYFAGRITFQFSEGDYLVSSGDTSMLELEVTSSGSHGGVTLRVIPLTLTSYLEQYPAQPCGSEEDLLGTTNYEAYSTCLLAIVKSMLSVSTDLPVFLLIFC